MAKDLKTLDKGKNLSTKTKKSFLNPEKGFIRPSEVKKKKDSDKDDSGSTIKLVIAIIIGILLLSIIVRMATGSDNYPTFTGFLSMLEDVPQVNPPFLTFKDLTITGDWWLFDFLRVFLNVIISIFQILVFLFQQLAQLVVYIGYFFKFIFVG